MCIRQLGIKPAEAKGETLRSSEGQQNRMQDKS